MARPDSTRPWAPGDPDREYTDLLENQAKKDGVTVDAFTARGRELYSGLFDAARARAARVGLTVEALYEHDRTLIEQSAYPGENCLQPFEVELFVADALAPERREHVAMCVACTALLQGVRPSPAQQEAWATEVRAAASALAAPAAQPKRAGRLAWATDAFATGVPIGLLGMGFGVYTANPAIGLAGLVTVIAACGLLLFGYHGRLVSPVDTFQNVWATSRGALFTAAAAGLVLFVAVNFWQQTEMAALQTQADEVLLEKYATSVATTAVGVWQSTGLHPIVRETGGALTIQARIIAGHITRLSPASITIEDEKQQSHDLLVAGEMPALKLNDRVIAVTNPEMTQLTSVAVLGPERAEATSETAPVR